MITRKDKYLFLDIDGVLNNRNYKESTSPLTYPCSAFDPKNIAIFNKLLEDIPDLQVIISSSWRTDNNLQNIFDNAEIKCHIQGITPFMTCGYSRGDEIKEWLRTCPSKDYTYVILDDCNDYNESQEQYLVLTDDRYGLTEEDCEKIKKIIGKWEKT